LILPVFFDTPKVFLRAPFFLIAFASHLFAIAHFVVANGAVDILGVSGVFPCGSEMKGGGEGGGEKK
jgi:hypothetical protein